MGSSPRLTELVCAFIIITEQVLQELWDSAILHNQIKPTVLDWKLGFEEKHQTKTLNQQLNKTLSEQNIVGFLAIELTYSNWEQSPCNEQCSDQDALDEKPYAEYYGI